MKKFWFAALLFLFGTIAGCESAPAATPANEVAPTESPVPTLAAPTAQVTDSPTKTAVPTAPPTMTPTAMVEPTLEIRPSPTPKPQVDRTLLPLSPPTQPENSEMEENALRDWLLDARAKGVDIYEVAEAMVAAGWTSPGNVYSTDFDQDGVDEWLVEFHRPQSECFRSTVDLPCGGDFWIIGEDRLEYEFELPENENFYHFGPIATSARFTDAYPAIVVIQTGGCGAHTCWDDFHIIGGENGDIVQLTEFPTSRHEWGKTIMFWHSANNIYPPGAPPTINMTYGESAILDVNGDGYDELVLVGGHAGSAGSGIQRTRTEVWGWTGTGVGLIDLIWHPTEDALNLLREGNDLYVWGGMGKRLRFLR